MGEESLVVTGETGADGHLGFILLAGRTGLLRTSVDRPRHLRKVTRTR